MADVAALFAQRAEIDARIAEQKSEAVQQVRDFMVVMGVTVEDLVGSRRSGSTKPVKYRNAAGQTWTGIGQRPRWLRAALLAGATLEQFAVTK
jgi:DNA-binding protein H-NS